MQIVSVLTVSLSLLITAEEWTYWFAISCSHVFVIGIISQNASGSGILKSNERSASKALLQSGLRRLCFCFSKSFALF